MLRGGIFAVAGQEERDDFLTGLDVQTSVREEEEEEEEEEERRGRSRHL